VSPALAVPVVGAAVIPSPRWAGAGLDVLCANAGIYPEATLDRVADAEDAMFATNVKGTIFAVQACVPALAESGSGRVVVTSIRRA
jgi:3-oxoacyl-[acyl-carrier protein] reductase